MFCDKCGSKVDDNDIYCPVCSNKIDRGRTSNKVLEDIMIGINLGKKKVIMWGVLILIVFGTISFYNSSSGKFFIAGLFAEGGKYNTAYNIVDSVTGEKGDAKREYYKLLIKVNDFISGTAEVYNEGDTEGGYRAMTQEEIDEAHWGSNDSNIVCSIDDIGEIRERANIVSSYDYLLSNGERSRLKTIESCIEKYDEEKDFADEFEEKLYDAYGIYGTAKYLKSGEYFNPVEMKEQIEEYNADLSSAREIYNNYISIDFYGYGRIESTVNQFTESMEKAVDKYGDNDMIYYNELTYDEPPYDNFDEISVIANNLRLHIAKYCFDNGYIL